MKSPKHMLGVTCNDSPRVRFALLTQIHAHFKYVFACWGSNFALQSKTLEFEEETENAMTPIECHFTLRCMQTPLKSTLFTITCPNVSCKGSKMTHFSLKIPQDNHFRPCVCIWRARFCIKMYVNAFEAQVFDHFKQKQLMYLHFKGTFFSKSIQEHAFPNNVLHLKELWDHILASTCQHVHAFDLGDHDLHLWICQRHVVVACICTWRTWFWRKLVHLNFFFLHFWVIELEVTRRFQLCLNFLLVLLHYCILWLFFVHLFKCNKSFAFCL